MTPGQAAEIIGLLEGIVTAVAIIMVCVVFHVIYQARHARAAREEAQRRG